MIEVFITNIQNKAQADRIRSKIQNKNANIKINFDLNETDLSFPCGHTILRMEGPIINFDEIIALVNESGFKCDVLEDKICNRSPNSHD